VRLALGHDVFIGMRDDQVGSLARSRRIPVEAPLK
jgi:hypothetical protein